MSQFLPISSKRTHHRLGCDCSYLNPVTEWAGGNRVYIVAYECPQCGVRIPIEVLKINNWW